MTIEEELRLHGRVSSDVYIRIDNDRTVVLDGCFDIATLQAVMTVMQDDSQNTEEPCKI